MQRTTSLGGAWLAAGLVVLLATAGCMVRPRAVPEPPPADREIEQLNRDIALAAGQATKDYTVGAEDLLEVTLFDIEEENGEPRKIETRVSQTGYITLPLVGMVKVIGLTPIELEQKLHERYRRYIRDPQITVLVKEYRSYRVSVVGFVEKPGVFEISGQKTLLEVLAMAGGLNPEAGKTIQVTRRTPQGLHTYFIDLDRLSRQGDVRLNLPMQPGDVVNVPKAGVYYVEGSVKKPGAYKLRDDMTVTQALAAAGGPDERLARVGGMTLFRRMPNGERKAIHIDIAAIRAGKARDVKVADNDVIVVPMSGLKYVVDRFIGSVGMGLSFPVLY